MAFRIKNVAELRQREIPQRDGQHRDAIRALPCLCCAHPPRSEAAHLRAGDMSYGKPMTGLSVKPDDKWTLPLCPFCHRLDTKAQHQRNELEFWHDQKINPFQMCMQLYEAGSHHERQIIVAHSLHERGLISPRDLQEVVASGE